MGRNRGKTSTFFTRFAYGSGMKQRSAIVPLSKSLGSPAPQISPIFKLPDELILSILSHISPDPQFASHYARFRVQYCMEINNRHERRAEFLLSLGMTCRTMRLRLLPWIWERIECFKLVRRDGTENFPSGLNARMGALHLDTFLAASVKFVAVYIVWGNSAILPFVRCIESLPNLHTLEIGQADRSITTLLENAIKRIQLPQIKTLIIPPTVYPLLRNCPNVEDVVCVIRNHAISTDRFLESLASNRDSKVKRLAIPLVSWDNPSRFIVACPMLTELTLIYPHPDDKRVSEREVRLNMDKIANSAILELVDACSALPDFDTLQIVYSLLAAPLRISRCGFARVPHNQGRRRRMRDVGDLAIDCLRKAKAGRLEGEGRKEATMRVIELNPCLRYVGHPLASVKVEEFEV